MDKHRFMCCMPARVLQGLAGPGRVERGGPEGPWQTVPLGEQLLPQCHPLSGTGAEVMLPVGRGSDSMSKRHVCVFLCVYVHVGKFVCEYRGHLQLPNFRGHAWASMGKSSRCMGHSALTVSLDAFIQTWIVS